MPNKYILESYSSGSGHTSQSWRPPTWEEIIKVSQLLIDLNDSNILKFARNVKQADTSIVLFLKDMLVNNELSTDNLITGQKTIIRIPEERKELSEAGIVVVNAILKTRHKDRPYNGT